MNWYKSAGKWTRGDGDCFSAALNLLLVRNFPKDKGDLLVHALVHGRASHVVMRDKRKDLLATHNFSRRASFTLSRT